MSIETAREFVFPHLKKEVVDGEPLYVVEFRNKIDLLPSRQGLVYFVEALGAERIKIGFTRGKVAARMDSLRNGCPFPLGVLKTVPGTTLDERRLHRKFVALREVGEWFFAAPALRKYIGGLL